MRVSNILTLMIVALVLYWIMPRMEEFTDCLNCGYNTKKQCASCGSCGWCTDRDGKGSCIPGDDRRPLLKDDCVTWENNNNIILVPLDLCKQKVMYWYRRGLRRGLRRCSKHASR